MSWQALRHLVGADKAGSLQERRGCPRYQRLLVHLELRQKYPCFGMEMTLLEQSPISEKSLSEQMAPYFSHLTTVACLHLTSSIRHQILVNSYFLWWAWRDHSLSKLSASSPNRMSSQIYSEIESSFLSPFGLFYVLVATFRSWMSRFGHAHLLILRKGFLLWQIHRLEKVPQRLVEFYTSHRNLFVLSVFDSHFHIQ